MIQLFQRNIIVQAVIIVAVVLLLWVRPLLAPTAMVAGDHPAVLYSLLCSWLEDSPRLAVVLAMLAVLTEGVFLNLLLANINLVSQNSLLPTLLFVIAMSVGTPTLTPAILVAGALIACLGQLVIRGTLLTITSDKACGATMFIGIATLFYQPAVLLMLSYLLIAASYRLYGWKDWAVMVLGFAIPYIALLGVLYMTDGIGPWWQQTMASLGSLRIDIGETGTLTILASAVLAVIFIWSLMNTGSRMGERPVQWQKNATTVILLSVGGIGMMAYAPLMPIQTALVSIPFAFCTMRLISGSSEHHTGYGRRKKRTWMYDTLLILILISAILC